MCTIKLLFARLMHINVFSETEPVRALKLRPTFIFRIICNMCMYYTRRYIFIFIFFLFILSIGPLAFCRGDYGLTVG